MNNPNETNENRTGDFAACSTVPPRGPVEFLAFRIVMYKISGLKMSYSGRRDPDFQCLSCGPRPVPLRSSVWQLPKRYGEI